MIWISMWTYTTVLLFSKDALNKSKVTLNTFIMLQKIFNANIVFFMHQRILKTMSFHKNIK